MSITLMTRQFLLSVLLLGVLSGCAVDTTASFETLEKGNGYSEVQLHPLYRTIDKRTFAAASVHYPGHDVNVGDVLAETIIRGLPDDLDIRRITLTEFKNDCGKGRAFLPNVICRTIYAVSIKHGGGNITAKGRIEHDLGLTHVTKSLFSTYSPEPIIRQSNSHAIRIGQDVIAKLKPSLAKVDRLAPSAKGGQNARGSSSSGTGFVINGQGHVLTNSHVVEDCNEVRGKIGAGIEELISVATDRANDLAVLKIKSFTGSFANFRNKQDVRAGDGLIVVGFPLPGLLTSLPSVTSGAVTALAGIRDDVRFYQISAPVQPGNSGGPVLDNSGNVIGVVQSKLNALLVVRATGDIPQNVNFAIKSSVAQNFLNTHGIEFHTASSDQELKPGQIGENAIKFTVAIECLR